jgi:hypothetical protein
MWTGSYGNQSVPDLIPVLAGRHSGGRASQKLGKVKLSLSFN